MIDEKQIIEPDKQLRMFKPCHICRVRAWALKIGDVYLCDVCAEKAKSIYIITV